MDDIASFLARRIKAERDRHGWSLADLAARSDVSKAMLSKIEREEVSPTAIVLSRIASGLGLTLAELLTRQETPPERLLRTGDQPIWRDPDTGYIRRQVFLSDESPLELVDVTLPAGKSVSFPPGSYARARHVIWLLEGKLEISEGRARHDLTPGDRLEFGAPATVTYRNPTRQPCRYLVSLLRV